ncbi:MAG TPA: hypothetical protein VKT49_05030 [Bryobacteraceae bacterium]|nr:hypothetical protein [Bryobacteraceae bacterium]
MTALAFGYGNTAEVLVRRGARGLADVIQMLPTANVPDRHRALALAAQHGHVEVVRLLLDAGEDPDRYNPKGNHGHSTPGSAARAGT